MVSEPALFFIFWVLLRTSDGVKREQRDEDKIKLSSEERERKRVDLVRLGRESCGIWSYHEKEEPLKVRAAEKDQTTSLKEIQVKVEPLEEVAAEEGQTSRFEVHEAKGVIYSLRQGKDELYQLVGRLKEVESELGMVKTHTGRRKQDVIFSILMGEICELVEHICDVWEINKKPGRWKRGTSCKKGKLRKLSNMWVMMRRLWRKDIKESMQVGECFYSAYMGESVESSGVMRKLETKGADERVAKEEWDEFVKYIRESSNPTSEAERTTPLNHERGNGTESHEQVHNQEDSVQHNQEVTQEVESGAQSSGDGQRESTGSDDSSTQSSGDWEVYPDGSNESGAQSSEDRQETQEEQVQELRRSTRVKRDASNWAGEAGRTTPVDHERGNGSESGEQEQNQEDSGHHNQEDGAQSSVDGQGESTGSGESVAQSTASDESVAQSTGSEESGIQSSEGVQQEAQEEEQVQVLRRSTRIKMDASNWVNTRV
ncbi:hypothetical protein DY000_02031612 [Brassica cretica]|uniref:DUF287 domain-containing protein n=1 Tax=Brassica cretica TaxID=69181 RepID=A0ABQ7DT90_BRACR|nr:hypothetical protein DY000_02031612 [Brassica cretica]